VNEDDLVRLVDRLEDAADDYVTLDEVQAAANSDLSEAIRAQLLLVDYRTRPDSAPVTLCRLNRRHPLVARITGW
jgi:hypothetical protein